MAEDYYSILLGCVPNMIPVDYDTLKCCWI